MSSTFVTSLARVYDSNSLSNRKSTHSDYTGGRTGTKKSSMTREGKSFSPGACDQASSASSSVHPLSSLALIERRVEALRNQMDKLFHLQEEAMSHLSVIGHEQARHTCGRNMEQMLSDMSNTVKTVNEWAEKHSQRLDALEHMVTGVHQAVSFLTKVFKHSQLSRPLKSKHTDTGEGLKEKDYGEKSNVFLKGVKSQKKKTPDITDTQVDLVVQHTQHTQQNSQLLHSNDEANTNSELLDLVRVEPEQHTEKNEQKDSLWTEEEQDGEHDTDNLSEYKVDAKLVQPTETLEKEESQRIEKEDESSVPEVPSLLMSTCEINQDSTDCTDPQESLEDHAELIGSAKKRVKDETLEKEDLKKSRVEDELERSKEETKPKINEPKEESEEPAESRSEDGPTTEEYTIDCSPSPSAPFEHRVVMTKSHQITAYYTINRDEILGGGRFGMVHKCVEKSSGLTLAAKIIKTRNQKEKEVVKSEIEVMNQLNHANLIQLYAAYESRSDVTLIMEYVEGGELFDRIIDENYKLTELDTVLLIRQITEGLQYMHKMYILHLDLKPENILCVSRETNKIKIIDFGLARRYKPREKLRVNFGTPEFLAPEVINYEFVSFPTDMWSLGVITYMLLSGLSPFLGDDDNETLNNILECKWSFEEAEFTDISEEAKDFITRLLIKSKSWRMSASQSLKHPWLSDKSLHYRLHQKKNKCHSTHVPPPES